MLDVFSPLTPDVQRANRAAYRQFLVERDGVLDVDNRTLSRREEAMARFTRPLSRTRELDRPLFYAQYAKFDPKREMSREALLLLAFVTLNAAEEYGVQQTFEMVHRRALLAEDDAELLLLIEECYHTRILLSAAPLYGLQIAAPSTPPLFLRGLIKGIVRGPDAISGPLVLASEVVATVMCIGLLHAVREIVGHDPELRDALEERVTDVLIDEIGHVSFNRTLLGPAGLATARRFLPLVAQGTAQMMPVFSALGRRPSASNAARVTSSPQLPEAVRRAAFIA